MLKVLCEGCEPTKDSEYSAGIDLYASKDVIISAGETGIVGLGVCIDLEKLFESLIIKNYFGSCSIGNGPEFEKHTNKVFLEFLHTHYLELHLHSSLRAKGSISSVDIINLDYKDEIKIIIHNPITIENFAIIDKQSFSQETNTFEDASDLVIEKGNKIAQILLKEHKGYLFKVKDK